MLVRRGVLAELREREAAALRRAALAAAPSQPPSALLGPFGKAEAEPGGGHELGGFVRTAAKLGAEAAVVAVVAGADGKSGKAAAAVVAPVQGEPDTELDQVRKRKSRQARLTCVASRGWYWPSDRAACCAAARSSRRRAEFRGAFAGQATCLARPGRSFGPCCVCSQRQPAAWRVRVCLCAARHAWRRTTTRSTHGWCSKCWMRLTRRTRTCAAASC